MCTGLDPVRVAIKPSKSALASAGQRGLLTLECSDFRLGGFSPISPLDVRCRSARQLRTTLGQHHRFKVEAIGS